MSAAPAGWNPMHTAPRDGTLVRLLVEFTEHDTEDAPGPHPTIGAWPDETDPDAGWQFAGWCWTHDRFTQGRGEAIGWLPMLSEPLVPVAFQAYSADGYPYCWEPMGKTDLHDYMKGQGCRIEYGYAPAAGTPPPDRSPYIALRRLLAEVDRRSEGRIGGTSELASACDEARALLEGGEQHPDDAAVDAFAARMKAKLAVARAKGRGGWQDADACPVDYLARLLVEQTMKPAADPVDVANFAMFLELRPGGVDALRALVIDRYHKPRA